MTWTDRRAKTFRGIKGLTDSDSLVPRLATIGRLHKGMSEEITTKAGKKAKRPVDLDYFRFTSDREEVLAAFATAYDGKPRTLQVYLPYPTPEENFQTCQEEWRAGGLVHRCDGETMTMWRDGDGAFHQGEQACPYHGHDELRSREKPGCRPVGRLNVILPPLVQAGFAGTVVLVTTSINDIVAVSAALLAVAEEQERTQGVLDLRGILWSLRRVPEKISTPGEGGRVRRQKWLVQIEPAVEWVKLQLEMARQASLPELAPAWEAQPPDWEDASSAGPSGGDVVEAEIVDIEEPVEAPGFAGADDEPPPESYDEPSASSSMEAWLADLKAAMQEAAVDNRPASQKQKTLAALLLQRCWPELEPGTALDERRREFTRLALGHKLSEASLSEASLLIRALGGDELDATAMGYVRALVARGVPGQGELFQEEGA